MQTEVKTGYKQSDVPLFYTYQTGVGYTRGKELTIGMAQLEASNENRDMICVGPVYQMTDYSNGHLDANGYRWYGEMIAKVYYRTQVMGEDFKPLQPKAIYRDASNRRKITVQFLVPKLPLVFDEHTLPKHSDYGFALYNNGQRVGISELKIVDDCVEIYSSVMLTGDVEVVYAGETSSPYKGHGNLRDSDDYQALYNYVDIDEKDAGGNYIYVHEGDKSLRPTSAEPKDETGTIIYGKPYPLYNFCVAFYYKLPKEETRVDVDFEYPTSISEASVASVIQVSCAGKVLRVAVSDAVSDVKEIKVCDISGKPVYATTSDNSFLSEKCYNLSHLTAGLYLVGVSVTSGWHNFKIIVE